MGEPKRQHKKYDKPSHPWQKERVEEEKKLKREYGLKNKNEVWKAKTFIDHISNNAKAIIRSSEESDKNKGIDLLKKVKKYNLIPENGELNEVLTLSEKDVLNRRLQTIVFNKGLSRSLKQARQFIVHGHIMIGENNVSVPSYLVKKVEEEAIWYKESSTISDSEHPERRKEEQVQAADNREFTESLAEKESEE